MSYPPLCLNIVSTKDWYFPVERERAENNIKYANTHS